MIIACLIVFIGLTRFTHHSVVEGYNRLLTPFGEQTGKFSFQREHYSSFNICRINGVNVVAAKPAAPHFNVNEYAIEPTIPLITAR